MVDKIPWDTCVIALIFCVFKTEFYKSTVFRLKLRCFPLPSPLPPIQCWNSEERACTLVQHFCRGVGEGWTSVDEFTPDCLFGACEKASQMWICPKTFVHDCRYHLSITHVHYTYCQVSEIPNYIWGIVSSKKNCSKKGSADNFNHI